MDRKLPADQKIKLALASYEAWADGAWTTGLLLGAVVLFVTNLDKLPLRDWDEGMVALVAREMVRAPFESLAWLYPRELTGQPYWDQPPLLHWLVAIAYRLGGVQEWSTRLPGALLTAVSVPVLYQIGREIFFQRSAALFAALVYLTSLPVVRLGRLALLDGAALCFFLVMLLCLLRSRRDLRWGLGIGIGFGLILLTKGAIAIFLGAIAILFMAWDTPRLLTSRYLWVGMLLGSVPALLWYAAQWVHYGEAFLKVHFLDPVFRRSLEASDRAAWYYATEVLKYGLPWLLFLPQGLCHAWDHRRLSWAKLVLLWGISYGLLISLLPMRLPWYLLPVYPAIALLVGAQLNRWWSPWLAGLREYQTLASAKLWVVVFGGLAIVAWLMSAIFTFSTSPQPDLQLVFSTLALTLTVTAVLMGRHDTQFIPVLLWGMYLTLLVFVLSNYWGWEPNEAYSVQQVAPLVQKHTKAKQIIYTSYPYFRPSLNFYSDRTVLPASKPDLLKHWNEDLNPYMLVETSWLQELPPQQTQVLGMAEAEDWVLVTHNYSPRFQPSATTAMQLVQRFAKRSD
jgi:4-amino-4-deoxy-L-arabinose transferase-like glycosyltransferase